jgi:hypothetical protein
MKREKERQNMSRFKTLKPHQHIDPKKYNDIRIVYNDQDQDQDHHDDTLTATSCNDRSTQQQQQQRTQRPRVKFQLESQFIENESHSYSSPIVGRPKSRNRAKAIDTEHNQFRYHLPKLNRGTYLSSLF